MSDENINDDDFGGSGQIPFGQPIAKQEAAHPSPAQAPVSGSAPAAASQTIQTTLIPHDKSARP